MPLLPPRPRRLLLGPLICGFAICNFLFPPIEDAIISIGPSVFFGPLMGIMAGFVVGFIAGQWGLLAIWCVFGPLRAPARLTAALTVCVFLFASLVAGFVMIDTSSADDMVSILWFLPIFFLAVQAPLWGLKIVTGGRITRQDPRQGQSATGRPQFGLRDVMVVTLVIAAALSLASTGMRVSDDWGTADWIPLSIFCLSGAAVSTFSTLPCLWAGMIARNKPLAAAIVAIYTLLTSSLCLIVIVWLNRGASIPIEVWVMLFMFGGTLMAVILATLHAARLCGYRFIVWRRPQPALRGECPFAGGDDSLGGTRSTETPAADGPLA